MIKIFCDICGREMKSKDYIYNVTMKHTNSVCVEDDNYSVLDHDFHLKEICADCRVDIYNFISDMQYDKQH